jgi:hypothetical protein
MLPSPTGREASPGSGAARYERHRPERTILYQLVQDTTALSRPIWRHRVWPCRGMSSRSSRITSDAGRLEHGFLRVRCDTCHAEHLVAFSWPLLRIPALAALVIPFTSQAPRFLPQLRGAAHGGRVQGCTR